MSNFACVQCGAEATEGSAQRPYCKQCWRPQYLLSPEYGASGWRWWLQFGALVLLYLPYLLLIAVLNVVDWVKGQFGGE